MLIRYAFVIIMALMVGACAHNPATGESDFVLMSESEELALGRQHSQQVMKEYRRYDDAALQAYVQSVGDRVAKVSHRNNLNYHFTLLDSTQVNAFALPGGYIYITRGLLAYLNSEAELAAVLGHELGHVTARHSVRQDGLSTMTALMGNIAVIATGSQSVGQLSNLLGTGITRGYGREHELEADGLGVEYLVKAGYPASSMRRVIATLKNQELFDKKLALELGRQPRVYHGVFSTHPDNDTRLQKVLTQTGSSFEPELDVVKQDKAFLSKLSGLTFGDSEQDGIVRNNYFYHADLNFKIEFPASWGISNGKKAITAQHPKGQAFVQVALQPIAKDTTPERYLKSMVGGVISDDSLSIGSFDGYTALVDGNTPYGQRQVRIAVLFVERRAFVFFATAKDNQLLQQFDDQFLTTINSFSRLTTSDKRKASELKLALVKVSTSKVIEGWARKSPIAHHAEDQLRLLNGFFTAGEPKTDDLLKIVR